MLNRFALLLFMFSSLFFPLYALTLTINVGRDAGENFSIVHVKEDIPFSCKAVKDDFDKITQVTCVFPREPKEKFQQMQTNFFKIDSSTVAGKYHIDIYPLAKLELFPVAHTLYEKGEIQPYTQTESAKHWMLVGYEKSMPLISPEKIPPLGINFPIEMAEVKMPSVGALDISGRPIKLDKINDVSAYMRIKSQYESGNYDQLAKDVDSLLKRFPQTIFKAELLLYKIRGCHHTDESEALMSVSKEYIREYSDDINMAEVLAYTANAYSTVGMQSDAGYFYERLFKEHPRSKFAALGMVYLGDQYISSGKQKPAESYFEKALYNTSDVEIASMAAVRLAKLSLDKGKIERTAELYSKVAEGNPKYLLYDLDKNYDIARALANRGDKGVAVDILSGIIQHLPQANDMYEEMVKDIGVWLSELDDKPAAYKALKRYQELYGESEYSTEVQEALDALFYAPDDANTTALIAEYETLEKKYVNQEIGQKASMQKARLYFKEKQYQSVLDMQGSGVENEAGYFDLEQDAAQALALETLQKGECDKAIGLSNEYNLTLEKRFDESLYECSFKTGNYALAKKTASNHLKDKNNRLLWLYRYAKTLNKLGKYEELTKVAKDVIALSEVEESSAYDDILHDVFYAHERLKNTQEMVVTIKELERRRGLKYDDIELYVSMVKLGLKEDDDLIVQMYAGKVMQLQEQTNSYSQSPFIEFAALQVLKAQKKEKEQLKLLNELIKRDLNDKEKSRVQYMLGALLMKEGKTKEAKTAFETSIESDKGSAWASLSKDALELLE